MKTRHRSTKTSRLRRRLRFIDKAIKAELKTDMKAIGVDVSQAINAAAPRAEGDMADAIHYRVSNDGAGLSIGYSSKAAGFKRKWKKGGFVSLWQEFGTKNHAAQPFIRPTWRTKITGALDAIDAAVVSALKKAVKSK